MRKIQHSVWCRENTVITVSIRKEPSEVVLQVHYEIPTLYQNHSGLLSPFTEAMFGEGKGLGLTLSQEIVERHGGHLEVETSDSKGVTCSVHLPFQTLPILEQGKERSGGFSMLVEDQRNR